MLRETILIVVDGDEQRLAGLVATLAESGWSARPASSVAAVLALTDEPAVALVHDDEAQLAELRAHLQRGGWCIPHIVYTEEPDWQRATRAMRHGASDYVALNPRLTFVNAALEFVRARKAAPARNLPTGGKLDRLSPREREVLGAVAGGMSNKAIARELGISHRTVEIHRANMLAKLGARNSPEAVRMAMQLGSES